MNLNLIIIHCRGNFTYEFWGWGLSIRKLNKTYSTKKLALEAAIKLSHKLNITIGKIVEAEK